LFDSWEARNFETLLEKVENRIVKNSAFLAPDQFQFEAYRGGFDPRPDLLAIDLDRILARILHPRPLAFLLAVARSSVGSGWVIAFSASQVAGSTSA
jgi:hypothetical protein